ncbi:stomatal closure-related actin-binding protein 2 [Forsythia ovata]|uniref:Stomatal closure-related actin-binding protein 2 n=1 Tax=Forsythia ovata TaxID=205694 RepID=A0ABD1W5K4_9LAMI
MHQETSNELEIFQVLNQIVCELPSKHPPAESRPLRELLGHTHTQLGPDNEILDEVKEDIQGPSLKEVVVEETNQLTEQQKRLSVRDLACKFGKNLSAAAKLSEAKINSVSHENRIARAGEEDEFIIQVDEWERIPKEWLGSHNSLQGVFDKRNGDEEYKYIDVHKSAHAELGSDLHIHENSCDPLDDKFYTDDVIKQVEDIIKSAEKSKHSETVENNTKSCELNQMDIKVSQWWDENDSLIRMIPGQDGSTGDNVTTSVIGKHFESTHPLFESSAQQEALVTKVLQWVKTGYLQHGKGLRAGSEPTVKLPAKSLAFMGKGA